MSKTKTSIVENESKGRVVNVQCVTCAPSTDHAVIGSIDKHGSEYDEREGWSVDWVDRFQIIQCGGCKTISFRHASWFSEDMDPVTGEAESVEKLYPKRSADSLTEKAFLNVPQSLRRIYRESIECFNNESPTLCAAGLRALVEGICAEHGVKNGPVEVPEKGGGVKIVRRTDLAGKIAGLQEKGLLTKTNANTLHEHRFLGNDAVHQLARPSVDELQFAIEIIEHTLEQLFELPEKAKELQRAAVTRKLKAKKP